MDKDRTRQPVAEPADEEIKKHGDPMKQRIAEAAQPLPQENEEKKDGKSGGGADQR